MTIMWGGRHGAGLNATFADGHVQWLPGDELWRVDSDGRGFYWFRYLAAEQ